MILKFDEITVQWLERGQPDALVYRSGQEFHLEDELYSRGASTIGEEKIYDDDVSVSTVEEKLYLQALSW